MLVLALTCLFGQALTPAADGDVPSGPARLILDRSAIPGGVALVIGGSDWGLAVALAREAPFLVHVLDTNPTRVAEARRHVLAAGLYGRVTAGSWDGVRLPLADGLVNLIIADTLPPELEPEVNRVLAPLGVTMVREGASWNRDDKPWPADIDEWTHYLHDAGNNAVAKDTRIGPPSSLQWIGSPRWSRHHDRIAALSGMVSAAGRVFYIFDEGPTSSIILPSKWSLVARDAFNGVVLWKKPIPDWQTRLWPLKSGPAQLPRRLVASADTVYATLGIDVPVTAIDARTGETVRTYDDTRGTEEILFSNGVLFLSADPALDMDKYTNPAAVERPWWTGEAKRVMAVDAGSGRILWERQTSVVPLTLAVDEARVYFHDGKQLVCLGRTDGSVQWTSPDAPLVKRLMSFFAPTLVVRDGVVLFAGGEESGLVKSTGGATKSDTITAFDAATGRVLWSAEHPPSGYSSPEDVFVIDGVVWYAGVSNGSLPGAVTGRDLHTGRIVKHYEKADVETYWFHHRCYRGKATSKYLMVARTGTEFIDPQTGHWDINHWTRGGCLYGIMPANGLVYTPPHNCICYPEAKLFGLCALSAGAHTPSPPDARARLERGPAYEANTGPVAMSRADPVNSWPTYRHDSKRSGATSETIGANLSETWKRDLGGPLSTVTVSDGLVFVAATDAHTVYALDYTSGEVVWAYTAGGRVDSPPTIHDGTAIFGCADGWLYCLRASDGALIWRFRAAPEDQRIVAFEQLESRWPLHGSVLVQDGIVYAVAGRSVFLDGGMHLCRVNARTGELISEELLDETNPHTGQSIQADVVRLGMPVGLPDVLSSDGKHVYMRSQVFDMEGKRLDMTLPTGKLGTHARVQQGETRHLFSPIGFLDGTWFHRSYWVYGRSFEGGWNAYYLAGKQTPTGKILSFDGRHVFGYGREPQYFKWTTPLEHQLYASPLEGAAPEEPVVEGSIVRVEKSESLNPANAPLTVAAWIRAEAPDGVVLARGGGILGYALYLKDGVPRFAVTADNKRWEVESGAEASEGWMHLTGTLTAKGELRLYVDGSLVGVTTGARLIPRDPADALQIGADESSCVGDYTNAFPFKGAIDEVRIYRGELSEAAIRALAAATEPAQEESATLVLYHKYDAGGASDFSGNRNDGSIEGAVRVDGRISGALGFSGKLPGAVETNVRYEWARKVPVLVRGMVATPRALFVAGPEDLIDEPSALKAIADPETERLLAAQEEAIAGRRGGMLMVVSAADGSTVSELRLDTIPVWDGLAAASGNLYMAGMDGTVRCFAGR